MAILGLKVPHEVARALGHISVPGVTESIDTFHITLIHLGHDVPIDDISKAIVVAYGVAETTKPIPLSIEEVIAFPPGDDGYPIIGPVLGREVQDLWKELCAALDTAKIEYSKKFPIFKPHVTLAYDVMDLEEPLSVGLFEWVAYEMVLWGGDAGDDRISVTLPFSMPGKEALYRRLVQARIRFPAGIQ